VFLLTEEVLKLIVNGDRRIDKLIVNGDRRIEDDREPAINEHR
jgi:hypothetical protein